MFGVGEFEPAVGLTQLQLAARVTGAFERVLAEEFFECGEPFVPLRRSHPHSVNHRVVVGEWPERQRRPGIHHQPQPAVGIVLVTGKPILDLGASDNLLVAVSEIRGVGLSPHGDIALGVLVGDAHPLRRGRPQHLHTTRQRHQTLHLRGIRALLHAASPGLYVLDLVGGELLHRRGIHTGTPRRGGQQERPHPTRKTTGFVVGTIVQVVGEGDRVRLGFQPGFLLQLISPVGAAACSDECVASSQVQPEPRGGQLPGHGRQPQGDLCELNGGGVEVDAVDAVQRDPRLHPLQLQLELRRRNPLIQLVLLLFEIQVGELVDGLDGERARAQCGLEHA